jgi:putative transposase
MSYSLNALYREAGLSKQAFHQDRKRRTEFSEKLSKLVLEADLLRSEHPGCGVEKMYYTLRPDFLGRDQFIEIFMDLGYRVRRSKNYQRTTIPVSSKFTNLIKGFRVTRPHQIWQSDITYYRVKDRYYYVVFIIDVFSKQIVGYSVSDSLRAESNMKALKMALKVRGDDKKPLIHHSDRGSQYIESNYLKLLKSNGIDISMGEKAQDNAYAERINGTIKNEYLKYRNIITLSDLKKEVKRSVNHYNEKRKHLSLPDRVSPKEFQDKLKDGLKMEFNIFSDKEIKSARLLDFEENEYETMSSV